MDADEAEIADNAEPEESEPHTPRHADPLVDDDEEALALARERFGNGGPWSREQAIHALAETLGYGRLGKRVRDRMDSLIRTAVRRGILDNTGGQFSLLCRSIAGYSRDHLIAMLLAAMADSWWDRDEAIRVAARYMGYRRTGSEIRKAFKSAINGAIRRGQLEYEGEWIRRTRD